ncbi:MAG: hypothetical protein EHM65_03490, partial [Acidobacteriales bacterium]
LPEQGAPPVPAAPDSIATAAKRLARTRQLESVLPAREKTLKTLAAELAQREKGMIQAETLAQAQAQLTQIVQRLAAAQGPPIEIRSVEVAQVRLLGDDYGEISIPMTFDCRIEQLVNLMAELTAQPEVLAVGGLRISPADVKQKTIHVRLTFTGVVARKLVPARGAGTT